MSHGLKRKLDYSDIAATPNDGKRYELIRGELLVAGIVLEDGPSGTTWRRR